MLTLHHRDGVNVYCFIPRLLSPLLAKINFHQDNGHILLPLSLSYWQEVGVLPQMFYPEFPAEIKVEYKCEKKKIVLR